MQKKQTNKHEKNINKNNKKNILKVNNNLNK